MDLKSKVAIDDDLHRAKLKQSHALRAIFNYNVGMQRIDHYFDVIRPALAQIDKNAIKGEVPVFELLEINANQGQ